MDLARLGETAKARSYYDRLVKEMKGNLPVNPQYERLRAEAAELLDIAARPEKQDSRHDPDEKEAAPTEKTGSLEP